MHSNDLEQKTSSVEGIINALSELEKDLDNVNSKIDEMDKRLMAYSEEEIDKLNQEIISLANNEAKKIIDAANAEAERESSLIVDEGDKNIARIKKNIDSSYDKAVDTIVKMVLTVNDSSDNDGDKNTKEPAKTSEKVPKGSTTVPNRMNRDSSDKTSKGNKVP